MDALQLNAHHRTIPQPTWSFYPPPTQGLANIPYRNSTREPGLSYGIHYDAARQRTLGSAQDRTTIKANPRLLPCFCKKARGLNFPHTIEDDFSRRVPVEKLQYARPDRALRRWLTSRVTGIYGQW